MEKYKINYTNNTIVVTAEFDKKLQNPNSDEYALIKQIKADFPNMRITHKTHRKPSYYVNQDGEITRRNQFKNLTYEHMEQFIRGLPNNEKYLAEYQYLRDYASKPQRSRYALIRKWFTMQFPRFRSKPLFYLNNTPETVKAQDIINEKEA